jgi:cell division septation protein DedD
MNQQIFNQNKRDAIKRMQEMQAKSIYNKAEKPKSKEQPQSKTQSPKQSSQPSQQQSQRPTSKTQQQQSNQSVFWENAHSQIQPQPQPQQQSKPQSKQQSKQQSNLLGGLNLPFLENLKTDGDLTLILGILLLLLSEKADKRLLFVLIYILL